MADGDNRNRLVACLGTACATVLLACIPLFEGSVQTAYVDPVGIVTACSGHTGADLRVGQTFTKEQCNDMLVADLLKHAQPVLRCTPGLKDQPYRLAAAVSFAYNVGTTAYCSSTFAKKLNANDSTACAELSRWTKAKGRVLPGLVKRRAFERDMCEGRLSGSLV